MEIREAILKTEYVMVDRFLISMGLKSDKDVTKTFYAVDDNDAVIGTISIATDIIKELAIRDDYRSENLSGELFTRAINYLREKSITSYKVFTKKEYKNTFLSLGLKEIVSTDKTTFLEGGISSIKEKIDGIKVQIKYSFGKIEEGMKVSCVVLNANPLTLGHMSLIEEASKNSDLVICFVVEEDKSYFSFKERFSFVYLSTRRLMNVVCVPSTEYMVSRATFPEYFLKDKDLIDKEHALIDSLIFKEYFVKELNISTRYIGEETSPEMVLYNETLKETLGPIIKEMGRIRDENGNVISASTVRKHIEMNETEEALKLVPREYHGVLLLSLNIRK